MIHHDAPSFATFRHSSLVTNIIRIADINGPAVDPACIGGVISIGNFDGVHRGHAQLLREVRRQADLQSCPAVAVALFPHPAVLLRPETAPARLTPVERRACRMRSLGIDHLIVCQTTKELLSLTAKEFFDTLIIGKLSARGMVEGPNFFFGRNRAGNIETLGELCRDADVELTIVTSLRKGRDMVSSTRIREMLLRGNVHGARELLGYGHEIDGVVETGDQRGREIGFPTANLGNVEVIVPGPGVYAGWAAIDGGLIKRGAAIHIGESPTFESGDPGKVEVHLMDFDGDLYGHSLSVEFVDRVRDVKRFDSAEQLSEQLTADVERVRKLLKKKHS